MNPQAQQHLHEHAPHHWWSRGQEALLRQVLSRWLSPGSLILDAGCGSGRMLPMLEAFGRPVGLDESLDGLRLGGYPRLARASLTALPFSAAAFDAVICLDAIEHVERDEAALAELVRVLRPGGLLALTVPAYGWLFSRHDVALGHYRRYSGRELRRKLLAAGVTVRYLSPFNTLLFPIAAAVRLAEKWRPAPPERLHADIVRVPPRPVNALLEQVFRAERLWLGRGTAPFGLSLLGIATK
ncbi:MAG: class I SAM-dependent methyltransferase [Candidatus Omnitrophica bacterium]|nr:class I SAM-dependent methyltransferase [Candidatus Omnitrophota bacterium]